MLKMGKQLFFLFLCLCTFVFMTWRTSDNNLSDLAREENSTASIEKLQQCMTLREKYASVKVKIRNNTQFADDMKELMSCPWKSNILLKERYRVELHSWCNASMTMILTKQNTVLGQKIAYEAEKRTRVVDDSLLQMLPESTPWRTDGQLRRCAVIGNGGILKNSNCGPEINRADFVIRLNLPPINVSQDVGVKTHLMTANPTQIQRRYQNLNNEPKPLADTMSNYGNAPLIMPAFAFAFCTRICFNVYRALKSLLPQQVVAFFNPDYLRNLHHYWRQRGQWAPRLSSGLMLTSAALELCEEVHLYGFWPFNFDLSHNELSHHYYDNVKPHGGLHSMPREFLQLLNLHFDGVINLHIEKCQ